MLLFPKFFKNSKNKDGAIKHEPLKPVKTNEQIAARKGELGEYKIDIQLDTLLKDYRHLNDLLVENPKGKSGYCTKSISDFYH